MVRYHKRTRPYTVFFPYHNVSTYHTTYRSFPIFPYTIPPTYPISHTPVRVWAWIPREASVLGAHLWVDTYSYRLQQQRHSSNITSSSSHILKYKTPRRVDSARLSAARSKKCSHRWLGRLGSTLSAVHWLLVCTK